MYLAVGKNKGRKLNLICRGTVILLSLIITTGAHAQDPFVKMLDDYANCAIELTEAKADKAFVAEDTRAGCRPQIEMIEMMLTAEMAQPILVEVELVLTEKFSQ